MKKTIFTIAALAVIMGFTACKKNYTCTCTTNYGGVVGTSTTTIKDTKTKAKDACEKLGSTSSIGGVTSTTTCTIN